VHRQAPSSVKVAFASGYSCSASTTARGHERQVAEPEALLGAPLVLVGSAHPLHRLVVHLDRRVHVRRRVERSAHVLSGALADVGVRDDRVALTRARERFRRPAAGGRGLTRVALGAAAAGASAGAAAGVGAAPRPSAAASTSFAGDPAADPGARDRARIQIVLGRSAVGPQARAARRRPKGPAPAAGFAGGSALASGSGAAAFGASASGASASGASASACASAAGGFGLSWLGLGRFVLGGFVLGGRRRRRRLGLGGRRGPLRGRGVTVPDDGQHHADVDGVALPAP
jgi:hypothetical protein